MSKRRDKKPKTDHYLREFTPSQLRAAADALEKSESVSLGIDEKGREIVFHKRGKRPKFEKTTAKKK